MAVSTQSPWERDKSMGEMTFITNICKIRSKTPGSDPKAKSVYQVLTVLTTWFQVTVPFSRALWPMAVLPALWRGNLWWQDSLWSSEKNLRRTQQFSLVRSGLRAKTTKEKAPKDSLLKWHLTVSSNLRFSCHTETLSPLPSLSALAPSLH